MVLIAFGMFVIGFMASYYLGRHSTASKQAPAPKKENASVAVLPKPQQTTINFTTDGVGQKEGIENPLIRQLIANPSLGGYTGKNDPESIKRWAQYKVHVQMRKEKLVGPETETAEAMLLRQLMAHPQAEGYAGSNDPASIRAWATQEAPTRAKNAGLTNYRMGKTKEVRVKTPGTVAFVFEKDQNGELQIVEYVIAMTAVADTAAPTSSASSASDTQYVTDTGVQLLRVPTPTVDMTSTALQPQHLYVHAG